MTPGWIEEAIPDDAAKRASADAVRTRIGQALEVPVEAMNRETVSFAQQAWELALSDALEASDPDVDNVRQLAERAFQLARVLDAPAEPLAATRFLVKLGCLGLLADRQADAARLLSDHAPHQAEEDDVWGDRTQAAIWNAWLRLIRKRGWADLDAVDTLIGDLREAQQEYEGNYLNADAPEARTRAWELVALYHTAHAAEILSAFATTGSSGGRFDVRQQLDGQFDRALTACERGELIELEVLLRILRAGALKLVSNSIWTVTRAVNSRVSEFVQSVVSRGRQNPMFEVLPPQREALYEQGLLGSSTRSVVVSLPTSSGKTLIAQFRILQALNQFDREGGWIAYLAPTRALVNQMTRRLREDFGPLGISVERVSPALEVDGLEADLLRERNEDSRFRVLVATPEKLDLLIRQGWEEAIDRPLTLVVVDEAHNLQQDERGLRLELLLATVNRECRYAQFLMLTPFLDDAEVLSRWLDPSSHGEVRLEVEWIPNDRSIMLSHVHQAEGRAAFSIELEALHTSHPTLHSKVPFLLGTDRPLGLSWSAVRNSPNKLAAATAELLKDRGSSIILAQRTDYAWSVAKTLYDGQSNNADTPTNMPASVALVRDFLSEEMGDDFPLVRYLEHGVGVHHSGISEDCRVLIEWLLEKGDIPYLVATTTISQGVNFPVASVILASHQYPYGQDIPPEDFWNVAGRTGRIGQGDLGIVALASTDENRASVLRQFVNRQVASFDSTLVKMALAAKDAITAGDLRELSYLPAWSGFLQYLAHSYRQIDDPDLFAREVEQVLRGALGYQQLRNREPELAEDLLDAVGVYAQGLSGKPLSLVDATGFSWESVNATLQRVGEVGVSADSWDGATLFTGASRDLRHMMGVILQVPELRENLKFAVGGLKVDGGLLAQVTSDWVQGRQLPEIADEYFSSEGRSPEAAMTDCCKVIYGKLAPTVSWGLSALQSLTLGDTLDQMSEAEAETVRNLPSRVFYGVNSDAAIALRLLGVPRGAATPLSARLPTAQRGEAVAQIRNELSEMAEQDWQVALGVKGGLYRSVWRILEGVHEEPRSEN